MKKKTLNYIQFTKTELDAYTFDKNSCVERINNSMHISFPPWGMEHFKDTLLNSVAAKKIGLYDEQLNGIVLDVRNIKLEGEMSLIRYDNPELHLTVWADFYIFKPRIGVTLKGIVKHVSQKHISVLIYRVFNVSIRFIQSTRRQRMQLGDEISFQVKKYDLQNIIPYIEGELMNMGNGINTSEEKKIPKLGKKINHEQNSSYLGSEKEEKFKPDIVRNKINAMTSSDSDSSDSVADCQDSPRNVCTNTKLIKMEPLETLSPNQNLHDNPQEGSHKNSISSKKPTDLKLPQIDKQIDDLINRYSQSSDTEVHLSPTRKKRKTISKLQTRKKNLSKTEFTSNRYSMKDNSLSLDSDSDEDVKMKLDVNSSISDLLNKVQQKNGNSL